LEEGVLDDIADHVGARPAEQRGVHVIADIGDENEQETGEDARGGKRQDDLHEGGHGRGVEIVGGAHQPAVQLLQHHVEGQHVIGEGIIDEAADDRPLGRENPAALRQDAELLQRAENEPLIGQNELPGQHADDEGDEEGQHDEEQIGAFMAPAVKGDPIGHGVGDQQGDDGGGGAVPEGADEGRLIAVERVDEFLKIKRDDESGDRVAHRQRHAEHGHERDEEEDEQIGPARQAEQIRC
jgi:hypothetical protein